MRTSMKPAFPLASMLVVLAACSAGDADAVKKDMDELRADVQRTQKENEKLKSQLATAENRINGLAQDLARVRQISADVQAAPAPTDSVAATDGGGAGPPPSGGASSGASAPGSSTVLSTPEGVAIRSFLATEDGKKLLEAAIQSDRDARAREQSKRQVDSMVDRFAKQAGLTDDQTKRMKDLMEKQADATRDVWASLQISPDATQAERDARRQQGIAKTDELRKSTDDQLRTILSTTQFETYQQEQDKLTQRVRGVGGNNGRRNNGGNANGNGNAGGRGNNANGN
jgi:hypothetical protein